MKQKEALNKKRSAEQKQKKVALNRNKKEGWNRRKERKRAEQRTKEKSAEAEKTLKKILLPSFFPSNLLRKIMVNLFMLNLIFSMN